VVFVHTMVTRMFNKALVHFVQLHHVQGRSCERLWTTVSKNIGRTRDTNGESTIWTGGVQKCPRVSKFMEGWEKAEDVPSTDVSRWYVCSRARPGARAPHVVLCRRASTRASPSMEPRKPPVFRLTFRPCTPGATLVTFRVPPLEL
jgi:hypothetical protein